MITLSSRPTSWDYIKRQYAALIAQWIRLHLQSFGSEFETHAQQM